MDMNINDITIDQKDFQEKYALVFAKDGNTPVRWKLRFYPAKLIIGLEDYENLYFLFDEERYKVEIYDDLGVTLRKIDRVYGGRTISQYKEAIQNYKYFGLEGFLSTLEQKKEKGIFVNNLEIKIVSMAGYEELAQGYREYRFAYLEKQRREEEKQAEIRRLQQEEEVKIIMQQAQQYWAEMQKVILEGGILKSEEVQLDLYKTVNSICYFMELNGCSIPAKTKGWIVRRLNKIKIDKNGSCYIFSETKFGETFRSSILEMSHRIRMGNTFRG